MIKHSDDKERDDEVRAQKKFEDEGLKGHGRPSLKGKDQDREVKLDLEEDVEETDESSEEGVPAETVEQIAAVASTVEQKKEKVSKGRKPKGRRTPDSGEGQRGDSEFIEKVIAINRITKVTKGGKKLSFSALVVVGDTKGNVGYSLSKAPEVATAIRKAMANAKKNMIRVPMKGETITHEIIGECSGSRVLLKPAGAGTGVIAAGPVRAVCDGAGIHNILTKCHRSNNPINVVKATIDGLSRLKQLKPKAEDNATASA